MGYTFRVSQKKLHLIASFLLFLAFFGYQVYKQYSPSKKVLSVKEEKQTDNLDTTVIKVVDGDTITVSLNGKSIKVRVLGINSPETVDPRKPVECFGHEASNMAKSLLQNKPVRLVADPTQSDKDKYGRLLRYVFLPDGTDFGLKMITEGYAYEYTYDIPYKYQKEYKMAQKEAEDKGKGLWSDSSCNGKK